MPAYEYRPLRHRSSIRVVELLPDETHNMNTAIRCRIHHTTINAIDSGAVKYQALSYVWGDITGTRPIFCDEDDKFILVTPNCEAALRHLLRGRQSRMLWIDAMCINQSQEPEAIRERSHQVKMMGDIYARADSVLVWLGQAPPSISPDELNHLTKFVLANRHDSVLRYPTATSEDQDNKIEFYRNQIHLGILEMTDGGPEDPDDFREVNRRILELREMSQRMLQYLESHSWFYRVWTFQEIALSKDAIVLVGTASLKWSEMEAWLIYAMDQRTYSLRDENTSQEWIQICSARISVRSTIGEALKEKEKDRKKGYLILNRLCDHQARDAKDMVFALQPILERAGLTLPDPDYTKSVAEIYEQTTFAVIEATKSLEILIHSRAPASSSYWLPSWVPDWHQGIGLRPDNTQRELSREVCIKREPESEDGNMDRREISFFVQSEARSTYHSEYHLPANREMGQLPLTGYRLGEVSQYEAFPKLQEKVVEMEVDELRNLWLEQLRNIGPSPDEIDNMWRQKDEFEEWLKLLHQRDPRRSSKLKGNLVPRLPRVMTFRFRLGDQCGFELSSGLVGVGEHNIQSGDVIALVHGSDFPLVLRPYRKHFRFVGCAYVWGAMQGDMWPEEEADAKSFRTRARKFRADKAFRGDEKGLFDIAKSMVIGFVEQSIEQGSPIKRNMELEEFILI